VSGSAVTPPSPPASRGRAPSFLRLDQPDIYAGGPKVPSDLLAAPNLTLLPHIGSATLETRTAMGILAVENLEAHFAGQPYPSRVA
jgi:lactate dehydrogenase-like 2-hydroxyacid dehydrogenase